MLPPNDKKIPSPTEDPHEEAKSDDAFSFTGEDSSEVHVLQPPPSPPRSIPAKGFKRSGNPQNQLVPVRPSADPWIHSMSAHSPRWVILTICAFLVFFIAATTFVVNQNRGTVTPSVGGSVPLEVHKTDPEIDLLTKILSRETFAIQQARDYLMATSPEDFLPFTMDAPTIAPLLAKIPHQPRLNKDEKTDGIYYVRQLDSRICGLVISVLPDGSRAATYHVMDGEKMLLDWKASNGYGTASFAELATGKGDVSEIRGFLKPEVFYSATFPEQQFQSYMLISPDRETSIWCYIERNSPTHEALQRATIPPPLPRDADAESKVTVSLRRSPEGRSNHWIINQLLTEDWFLSP